MDDANHVYCLHCDYDLRGLAETGDCPECGLSIADSTKGRLLRFTDRESLTTLHSALLFLIVGTGFWTAYEIARTLLAFSVQLVFVLAMAPLIVGLWWISIPETRAEKKLSRAIRKSLRAYAVLAAAYCVYLMQSSASISSLGLRPMLFIDSILILFPYAGQTALMLRLKTIAEQIPSAKLTRFANQLVALAALIFVAAICWRVLYVVRVDDAFTHHRLHLLQLPTRVQIAVRWSLFVLNAFSILLMRSLARRVQQQIDLAEPADEAPKRERAIL